MRATWTPLTDSSRSPASFSTPLSTAWLLAGSLNQRDNVHVSEHNHMNPKNHQFASFLTKHRKAAGLSMEELAGQVGTTKSNVHYWESGEWLPSAGQLEPLAQALKLSYEDVFAAAGYSHPAGLPEPEPYLRAKFPGISERKVTEAKRLFRQIEASEQRSKKGRER